MAKDNSELAPPPGDEAPSCPSCGARMARLSNIPAAFMSAPVGVYRCPQCGTVKLRDEVP